MKKIFWMFSFCAILCQTDAKLDFDVYSNYVNNAEKNNFDYTSDLTRGFMTLNTEFLDMLRCFGGIDFSLADDESPRRCSMYDASDDPTMELLILTQPSAGNNFLNSQGRGSIDEILYDKRIEVLAGMFNIANATRKAIENGENCEILQEIAIIEGLQKECESDTSKRPGLKDAYIHFADKYFGIREEYLEHEKIDELKYELSKLLNTVEKRIVAIGSRSNKISEHQSAISKIENAFNEMEKKKNPDKKKAIARATLTQVGSQIPVKNSDYMGTLNAEYNIRKKALSKIQGKAQNENLDELSSFQAELRRLLDLFNGKDVLKNLNEELKTSPEKERLVHIQKLCESECGIRSTHVFKLGCCVAKSVTQERKENEVDPEEKWNTYFPEFTNDIICACACGLLSSRTDLEKLASLISDKRDFDDSLTKFWGSLFNSNRMHFPFAKGENPLQYHRSEYMNKEFADCAETTLRHLFTILFSSGYDGNISIDVSRIPETKLSDANVLSKLNKIFKGNTVPTTLREFFGTMNVRELAGDGTLGTRSAWAAFCEGRNGIKYVNMKMKCELVSEWKNAIKLLCSIMADYPEMVRDSSDKRVRSAADCISKINNNEIQITFDNVPTILNQLLGIRTDIELVAEELTQEDLQKMSSEEPGWDCNFHQEDDGGIYGALSIHPKWAHPKSEQLNFAFFKGHALLGRIYQDSNVIGVGYDNCPEVYGKYMNPNILKKYPLFSFYNLVNLRLNQTECSSDEKETFRALLGDIFKSRQYTRFETGLYRMLRAEIIDFNDLEEIFKCAKPEDREIIINNIRSFFRYIFDKKPETLLASLIYLEDFDRSCPTIVTFIKDDLLTFFEALLPKCNNYDEAYFIARAIPFSIISEVIERYPAGTLTAQQTAAVISANEKKKDSVFKESILEKTNFGDGDIFENVRDLFSDIGSSKFFDEIVKKDMGLLENPSLARANVIISLLEDKNLISQVFDKIHFSPDDSSDDLVSIIGRLSSKELDLLKDPKPFLDKYTGHINVGNINRIRFPLAEKSNEEIIRKLLSRCTITEEDLGAVYSLLLRWVPYNVKINDILIPKLAEIGSLSFEIAKKILEYLPNEDDTNAILGMIRLQEGDSIFGLLESHLSRRNNEKIAECILSSHRECITGITDGAAHVFSYLRNYKDIKTFLDLVGLGGENTFETSSEICRKASDLFETAYKVNGKFFISVPMVLGILNEKLPAAVKNEFIENFWGRSYINRDILMSLLNMENMEDAVEQMTNNSILCKRLGEKILDYLDRVKPKLKPEILLKLQRVLACCLRKLPPSTERDEFATMMVKVCVNYFGKSLAYVNNEDDKKALSTCLQCELCEPKAVLSALKDMNKNRELYEENDIMRFANLTLAVCISNKFVSEYMGLYWRLSKNDALKRIKKDFEKMSPELRSYVVRREANGLAKSNVKEFTLDEAAGILPYMSKHHIEKFIKEKVNFGPNPGNFREVLTPQWFDTLDSFDIQIAPDELEKMSEKRRELEKQSRKYLVEKYINERLSTNSNPK